MRKRREFLATTALEDYWDTSLPIVFLGPWCLRYSRRQVWQGLQARVSETPWATLQARVDALHLCNGTYEKLLRTLGTALDGLHGEHHSLRYWRILLGPWLSYYVATTYDRWIRIHNAINGSSELISFGLSASAHTTPVDTLGFEHLIQDDYYNLQLTTRILEFCGIPLEVRGAVSRHTQRGGTQGLGARLASAFNSLPLWRDDKGGIVLRATQFPWRLRVRVYFASRRRIRPVVGRAGNIGAVPIDSDKRNNLQLHLDDETAFEALLGQLLHLDLPQVFLESYPQVGSLARQIYGDAPKAIVTANAQYTDEVFKRFAATSMETGTLLLGNTHGTRYGCAAWMRAEEHEIAIFDRYYTWGWERSDCAAYVKPMPAPKLMGRRSIGASNARRGILWVTTTARRYPREFPFSPEQFLEYLQCQTRFLNDLRPELKLELRLRPHHQDQGWDIVDRLKDCYKELAVEDWAVSFAASVRNCRLYVCDHCSTTFGEALAQNVPAVLFWNEDGNELRQSAQPYFDSLRRAGILHHSPDSAAALVNRVYGDVEQWWNSPDVQSAREMFCDRFVRTSRHAFTLWTNEFLSILDSDRN